MNAGLPLERVSNLEVVRSSDVREVRMPGVRHDPAGRRQERAAAQRAARPVAEPGNAAALFPDLDEVERGAAR